MSFLPFDEYVKSLNRKRMSAGVLFCDNAGRVLLVEPSYKPHWDIPGGAVDADEAPWTTAVREVREELGVVPTLGRPLVIDHVPAHNGLPEGIAFVFDGGTITDAQTHNLSLTDPEIVSIGLFTLDETVAKAKPSLVRRIGTALEMHENGGLALCEDGQRITG